MKLNSQKKELSNEMNQLVIDSENLNTEVKILNEECKKLSKERNEIFLKIKTNAINR